MDSLTPHCSHYSEDVVEGYSLRRLPQEEAEVFEEHLMICVACQNSVADFDEFIVATRAALSDGIEGVRATSRGERRGRGRRARAAGAGQSGDS